MEQNKVIISVQYLPFMLFPNTQEIGNFALNISELISLMAAGNSKDIWLVKVLLQQYP